MPAPLVDLESLDLSRSVYAVEDLQQILRQRGTFSLIDGVLHLDRSEGGVIVGYKDVRSDDWWAKDHIPGRPLFPGVLMVEASAQLGSFDFFKRTEVPVTFIGFTGIDNTRFRGTVEPPCRLYFVGKVLRMRATPGRTLFTYQFQGLVAGKIVFETEVTGMQL